MRVLLTSKKPNSSLDLLGPGCYVIVSIVCCNFEVFKVRFANNVRGSFKSVTMSARKRNCPVFFL